MLPAFHLERGSGVTRLSGDPGHQARPLNEPDMPMRPLGGRDPAMLHTIVDWLAVDVPGHARWAPLGTAGSAGRKTFCNVYAYDVAFLAGVFLPRWWWTERGAAAVAAGRVTFERDGRGMTFTRITPPAQAEGWFNEFNANEITGWLGSPDGQAHGWRAEPSAEAAQQAANAGRLVVWSGARANDGEAGHITVLLPETATHAARRDGAGRIAVPLQSQAGARNLRHFADDMFDGHGWRTHGLFVSG